MKRLQTTKRLIAAVLSFVMVLGVLPVIPFTVNAEGTQPMNTTQDYVSLPITIRDYAADGMLFEYNDIGATGTHNGGEGIPFFASYSMVGGADNVSLSGTTLTIKRNQAFGDDATELTRYLRGKLGRDVNLKDMRYLAIKYSQSSAEAYKGPKLRFFNDGKEVAYFALNYACNGTTHNLVLDLSSQIDLLNKDIIVDEVRFYSGAGNGVTTNIYWANCFGIQTEANNYKNSGGQWSSTYKLNNTLGLGLLYTNNASILNDMFIDIGNGQYDQRLDHVIKGSSFYRNGKWGTGADAKPLSGGMAITLNSGAKQNLVGGMIRTDLVESYMVDGKPVYTPSAVEYVAKTLKDVLPVGWSNGDGTYNMWHVMGQKLPELGGQDLASKLRVQIQANGNHLGSYEASKAAFGTEELDEYSDIKTYFDAAYFLLHSTFADNDGYGKTVPVYKEIRLVEKKDNNGKTYYVFNSGYNNTAYDTANGAIYNTQTTTARYHNDDSANATRLRGLPHYYYRFDPLNPKYIGNAGYGMSGDTYRTASDMLAVNNADEALYYRDTNYHLSLEGHAQFVYYYEDDLFFTFTGDDDVYLYINGVRVVDLGGAHAISKVTLNINDVAKICGLEDGESYAFDFFYMERHGTAANFSIETNIKIVDPAVTTTKKAYQDGVEIGYNGFVKDGPDDRIIYEFGIENKGTAPLKNLTFNDPAIGVAVSYEKVTLNSFTKIGDVVATITGADGTKTVYKDLTTAALKQLLADGIDVDEKITLYGFAYNVPDSKWNDKDAFPNRVETSAHVYVDNTTTHEVFGFADWMVHRTGYRYDNYHLYAGGKLDKNGALIPSTVTPVTLSREELLQILVNATDESGNALHPSYPNYTVALSGINDTTKGKGQASEFFTAAGYGADESVLMFYGNATNTHFYRLGAYDLTKYKAVTITYGSDGGAMLGDYGSELYLTDAAGNELGRSRLSNPTAGWKAGSRTVTIAVDSDYSGDVYLRMTAKARPDNSLDGIAVNKVVINGKDSNMIAAVTYPDKTVTIKNISGYNTNQGGYDANTPVLLFSGWKIAEGQDIKYNIGTLNLKQYGSVQIQFSADRTAMLADYGSALYLVDANGNELGRATLTNPVVDASWKDGVRTVSIEVNSTYNGAVYLKADLKRRPNSTGNPDGVVVTGVKLMGKASVSSSNAKNATINITTASGSTAGGFNTNAVVNSDKSITYTPAKPGRDVYYYTVTGGGKTYGPITVEVFTYAVGDNVFVLDYNLPVELNDGADSYFANDILDLGKLNPYGTTNTVINNPVGTKNYGEFVQSEGSLKYVMNRFMDGVDTIDFTYRILEDGATKVTKFTGVELTQTVTVAPANVMYYEDNFTGENAITYVNTGSDENGNIWAVYEGTGKGNEQSANQDMNYGSDPNYDTNGTDLKISYLEGIQDKALLDAVKNGIFQEINGRAPTANDNLGLAGDASNGTIHALAINNASSAKLMEFTFTGTGFEIVGRTTQDAYAVLTAVVESYDEKGNVTMRAKPVITECVSGNLYQVPFMAFKDLSYGTHKVTIYSSNVNNLDRMVYVDGVRIYQPLDEELAAKYYKADETSAEFFEIKDQILAGNIVYGDIGELNNEGSLITWGFGNTMIENFRADEMGVSGEFVLTDCSSADDYLVYGPNNEIYLSNANGACLSYIAFYVVLDQNYQGERSIQVGAHLKTTEEYAAEQSVSLRYGNKAADFLRQDNAIIIESGTEQYYTVDVDWKPVNNNGVQQTLVVIGIDNIGSEVLTLTNIKLNGYKFATTAVAEMTSVQDMHDINACTLMSRVVAIGDALVNKD